MMTPHESENTVEMPQHAQKQVAYACPYCGGMLAAGTSALECHSCGKSFHIMDGIPVFKRDQNYYYGEVSQEKMRELLAAARAGDWRPAFEKLTADMRYSKYHAHYALSERRAGWWPLVGVGPESRVLDYGCGWGPISYALAKRAGVVVSCDACLERVQFWQIRARQENIPNVQFVWAGDTPRLPFADGQFDLIVLNGVLEWIPASQEGHPGQIQESFLREAARVLSPQGQIVVAMENRYNWYYFLGKPEDHSKIRFVSLLPRWLAAFYAKIHTGDIYRNWTYSYWGQKKLMKRTGFSSADVLVPLPDYREFRSVVDPSRPATVEKFFEERDAANGNRRFRHAKGLAARLLAPSFCVVGHRGEPAESFAVALGREIAKNLPGAEPRKANWTQLRVSRADVILLELDLGWPQGQLIIKLPLNARAAARCMSEAEIMKLLRGKLAPKEGVLIPQPVHSGMFRRGQYFVETKLEGVSASHYLHSKSHEKMWKDFGTRFLAALHRQTATTVDLDEQAWKQYVLPRISAGVDLAVDTFSMDGRRIEEYLFHYLGGTSWPFGINHGDYWAGNLLLSQRGAVLSGVIDWDRCDIFGLPLIGILHFLMFSKLESQPGRKLPDLIGEALQAGRAHFQDVKTFDLYLNQMQLEVNAEKFKAFLLLYWLHFIAVSRTTGKAERLGDSDWIARFVTPAGSWLPDLLRSASTPS